MAKRKMRVFVSYSHGDADRTWIRAFVDALQRRGARVWFDESEVRAGEPLLKAMEKGLRGSDMIVAIVTPASAEHPWVFFELGAALASGKRFVVIVPDGFDPALLPPPLRNRRVIVQGTPEEAAEELLSGTPVLQET
jgi:hypothetical protein